jgi:hypothetical protein
MARDTNRDIRLKSRPSSGLACRAVSKTPDVLPGLITKPCGGRWLPRRAARAARRLPFRMPPEAACRELAELGCCAIRRSLGEPRRLERRASVLPIGSLLEGEKVGHTAMQIPAKRCYGFARVDRLSHWPVELSGTGAKCGAGLTANSNAGPGFHSV